MVPEGEVPGPPLRVLLLDDSDEDADLVLRALGREGYAVVVHRVQDEKELRRALQGRSVDIVLSDFSMPVLDGLAALQVVRELRPALPFIFVSGTIGEERAIEAMRQGATDYVLKDNLRRLAPAVRRALADAAERARRQAAEEERTRLVEILEATSDIVAMAEPDGRLVYLNAAGRRITGMQARAPRTLRDLHPASALEVLENVGRPAALQTGLWHGETAVCAADGGAIPVSQVVIAHRAPDGSVRFISTVARDIRERKAYEARIEHLANYDALTGLPNRTLLADRTTQGLSHARRFGRSAALLLVNVDRFKLINESSGHAAGDRLLCMVGKRLQSAVRDGDTVARVGGDVFAVHAANLARPDDVVPVVRKLQGAMVPTFQLDGRELHASFSIGASTYPRDGESFDLLLRNADAAMNRVKAAGGNDFQFYAAGMTREAQERLELESELRGALERRQLQLHYQPVVRLATGAFAGVEALMRWRAAGRGWVPPTTFIRIAEECDLIHPLGEFALLEACSQALGWDALGLPALRMSVNVSARQFRSPGFVGAVQRVLDATGMDPRRLELELTESVLLDSRAESGGILSRLKDTGVLVAVDDFGTGYSSLSYLSRLPIDCLKIDRSFVQRICLSQHDAAIVQAVISLGRSLGLRVVAEGVETSEQLEFVRAQRCDEAQGYLFARPAPGDAIRALLADGASSLPAGGDPASAR